MSRKLLSFGSALGLMALLPVSAGAVELPVRKAGLWEMKVQRTGAPSHDMLTYFGFNVTKLPATTKL